MEHVVLIWEVVHDEEVVCAGKVEALELEPEKTGKITLPYKVEEILPETDYYLNLSLVYKEANQYAEAGMEIAHAQFKLPYHKSGKAQRKQKVQHWKSSRARPELPCRTIRLKWYLTGYVENC